MSLIRFKNPLGIKWNSFADNFFDDFNSINQSNIISPAANIVDEKEYFLITLAVPGIKKDEFTVELKEGQLTISGKKRKSSENKEDNYTRQEYSFSSFKRSFNLPKKIKADEIEAKYENGELKIRVPKSEIVVTDRIEIQVS